MAKTVGALRRAEATFKRSTMVSRGLGKRRIGLLLGSTALVALAASGPAYAIDATWTGTAGTSWSAGANWDTTPTAPLTGDRASLTGAGGANQPTVLGGENLSVGAVSMTGANTLTIQAGGTLNVATGGGQTGLFQQSAGTLTGSGLLNVDTFTMTGGTATGVTISAATAFNLSGVTVSDTLVGAGALTTSGAVTLNGANSYSGGTSVTAGQLTLGNAAALGSSSNTVTVAGGVLDLGGLTVTQNGGLQLQSGTIQNGTLASSGTFDLQSGTVSATLTGAGAVSKTTAGTVTLTDASTYTGGTTLAAGTIAVGNNTALGSGSVAVTGNATLSNTGGTSVTIANAVDLGANQLTLSSGVGGGGNLRLDGNISGAGGSLLITQASASRVILAGNETYSGATIVSGTLEVLGSINSSALTVNNGGVLTGTGTVGATQIDAGGAIAPGDGTPGTTMTLASLTLQAGARYQVQINPATSSFANVTGNATLGGATVGATFASGSYVEKKYTILTAGSISGTFDPAVASTNLPSNFKTGLSYDATHAYLDLSLSFLAPSGSGLSVNQQNVANTLVNFFNGTGGIPLVFGALTPAGLTQLSGEVGSAPQQATFNAMNQFLGLMTDPFISGRGDPISAGGVPNAFADESLAFAAKDAGRSIGARDSYAALYTKAPPAQPAFVQRWSVWAAGFGGAQQTDGNRVIGSSNTTSNLYSTAVGADYRISRDTLVGFALAGGGTNFTVANALGGGRSDLFQAGAFFRHNAGPAYITGALAYGWQDIVTDRTVTVAGSDRLRAEFNANAYSGRLEGGYRLVTQGFGWTPYAAAQFTTFDLPAYAEQVVAGSNQFALAYGARSITESRSELGLRTDKAFAQTDGIVTLRGRVAWAHDFNPGRAIGATFQSLPGASFVVNGAAMASDSALVTAAVEKRWLNGWSAAGIFEGEFSNLTRSYAGKGVIRYAW
ncbi:autotransporter domain-containing protein [Bradyrhizobium sp. U531]|uniref:autotransporter outer membrane beta-barrel domain-containing protein n=1 Tax=Bradyrhizobium sp. U531 TaxID=3053458 RepID=UPI003F4447AB